MPAVHAAFAAFLVATVVAVAFASAAPELGVAEFAPAARRAVEAPPTTAGEDARGAAPGRRGPASTVPRTASTSGSTSLTSELTAATTVATRSRSCFGNPPRQTEDPMAPPCIATIFEGDNGGATTGGVSGTEIRVGVAGMADGTGTEVAAIKALFDFVNRHFEFYGRKLVPVFVSGVATDPVAARALATEITAQGAFAALTGYLENTAAGGVASVQAALLQELARNHIVTVTRNAGLGWSDRVLFDAEHPYLWSVYPSAETNLTNLGDFVCIALAGGQARHALDASLRGKTRRFGILAMGRHSTPPPRPLAERLTACDRMPVIVEWSWANDPTSTSLRTGLTQLQAAGVTSVVCVCESVTLINPGVSTANSIGYRPEWVGLPTPYYGDERLPQAASYRAAYIRLDSGPRVLPAQARPWFGALLETNPQLLTTGSSNAQAAFRATPVLYDGLLALAAGIQGAGPNLDANSFAQALMSTSFPNPGAGAPPFWQPSAGFGPGDHAFHDDYAVAWWSDTAPAVEYAASPLGSWCYLGGGTRFRAGAYPADADGRLYNPAEPCR